MVVEPVGRSQAPRETFLTRSVRTAAWALRVVVARCPGGAAQREVELQIEDFTAAMGCDRKDGACLREIVRPRKASTDRGGAKSAELSTSIPPFGEIHLAKSRNN